MELSKETESVVYIYLELCTKYILLMRFTIRNKLTNESSPNILLRKLEAQNSHTDYKSALSTHDFWYIVVKEPDICPRAM